MSIASYKRNVKRGVTGPYSDTCFPSALEQLSPYSMPPRVYTEYKEFVDWWGNFSKTQRAKHNEECKEMFDHILRPLGGLSCEDVLFKRARTVLGFTRIVLSLLREDYQIAVDVRTYGGTHTVGLLPTGDPEYFMLLSTYIPKRLEGPVTLSHVGSCLVQPTDPFIARYPFNDANITALPPAA